MRNTPGRPELRRLDPIVRRHILIPRGETGGLSGSGQSPRIGTKPLGPLMSLFFAPLLLLSGMSLATGALPADPYLPAVSATRLATRIVVMDLQPHGDHVHVGSLVEVPAAYGSVQNPVFLDHGILLFRSSTDQEIREGVAEGIRDGIRGGVQETSRVVVYDLFDGMELGSARIDFPWWDPRRIPGSTEAITLIVGEEEGSRSGRIVRLTFGPSCPDGCLEPLALDPMASPLPTAMEHAWLTPDTLLVLVETAIEQTQPPANPGDRPDPVRGELQVVSAGAPEGVRIATDAMSPIHGIPRSEDASFIREAEDGRRYHIRISAESGALQSSRDLPPHGDLLDWYSPVTAFLVYEGGLFRSTDMEAYPWVRILDPVEVGAPILDFAVSPSGFRVALVLEGSSP